MTIGGYVCVPLFREKGYTLLFVVKDFKYAVAAPIFGFCLNLRHEATRLSPPLVPSRVKSVKGAK
jgi:hypothetical protein